MVNESVPDMVASVRIGTLTRGKISDNRLLHHEEDAQRCELSGVFLCDFLRAGFRVKVRSFVSFSLETEHQ
jgi:hypothetical protein